MCFPGQAVGDLVIEPFQRAQSCTWHRSDTVRPVIKAWDSGRCLQPPVWGWRMTGIFVKLSLQGKMGVTHRSPFHLSILE